MEYTVISSRSNDRVKNYIKLSSSSSYRRAESLFTVEGARLCYDALRSGYKVKELYFTQTALEKYGKILTALLDTSEESFLVSDQAAQKLSDTVNPQGVFCVVRMNNGTQMKLEKGKKYVALEDVQNPLNLGSVARTAEALGIDAVIVGGGCDVFNPKAMRASMGSLLRIPVYQCADLSPVINEARSMGILTVSTVPDESAEDITELDFSKGAVCVIGNEGNGVSEEIKALTDVKATIRMKGNAESLNASVAATIAVWEMMR